MTRYSALRFAIAIAATLTLPGCGLLSGGKPAQLYRFGAIPVASAPGRVMPITGNVVLLMPVRVAAEIDGDRVLASRGGETLYIKGIRWVAPSPALFAQALSESFRERAPSIEIVDQRAGRVARAGLQVNIRRFEARYDSDPKGSPIVTIEGDATLIDTASRLPIGSYRLAATHKADRNDAAAITAAFDQVASTSLAELVDWANKALVAR